MTARSSSCAAARTAETWLLNDLAAERPSGEAARERTGPPDGELPPDARRCARALVVSTHKRFLRHDRSVAALLPPAPGVPLMNHRRLRRYALSAMIGFVAAATFLTIGARFIATAAALWGGAVACWGLGAWAADQVNRHAILVRTIEAQGVARVVRSLEPAGKVEVGGELWNARTLDGSSVGIGEEVEILSRLGLELWVRARES